MATTEEYEYYNYSEDYTSNYSDARDVGLPDDCLASHTDHLDIFLPILYYVIFLSGFLGNLLVIFVVSCRGKRSGRLVDTFILNLAIADLIFVLTLPLWAMSARQNNLWEFGKGSDFLCRLSSFVITVNRYSNIFFLTCMSVDRYVAVVKLMDSRYLRSSRCIYMTCTVVWFASLLLGVPSLVYRELKLIHGNSFCIDDSESKFFLSLTLAMTLMTFVFPVLIIVYSYGTIVVHLNRHCITTTANARTDARRRHSVKMVLLIVIVFVLSWLPYNIFKTITTVHQLAETHVGCERSLKLGLVISSCLAFFNSCINPVIYFCLDHSFRQRANHLFNKCAGKTENLQSYNSSSFTNFGTSESCGTVSGKTQFIHIQD